MTLKTTPFDVSDHLETPEDIAAYLQVVFEENQDPELIKVALGNVARSVGMTRVAEQAGITRPALYKALSETGDPRLSTLVGVCKALGIKLAFQVDDDAPEAALRRRARAGAR